MMQAACVVAFVLIMVVGVYTMCRPAICPKCGKRALHVYADSIETLRSCRNPKCGFYERSD